VGDYSISQIIAAGSPTMCAVLSSEWLLLLFRFSKSRKRTDSDGFVKKICRFGFGSWWRHYKLMYTPAIEHSSCPRWAPV